MNVTKYSHFYHMHLSVVFCTYFRIDTRMSKTNHLKMKFKTDHGKEYHFTYQLKFILDHLKFPQHLTNKTFCSFKLNRNQTYKTETIRIDVMFETLCIQVMCDCNISQLKLALPEIINSVVPEYPHYNYNIEI